MRIAEATPGEKGEADIRLIRLGHREHRAIGDTGPLADSIRDGGLRHPVVISPRYGLITGRRRLAACERAGLRRIPYRAVGTVPEVLPIIAEEDADTRQSLPMTVAEAMYRDWQMRDELDWWPRAGHNRGDPEARYDHRVALATAAGLNASQYTRAREVILAAGGWRSQMGRLHLLEDETAIAAAREAAKILETTDGRVAEKAYRHYHARLPAAFAVRPAATAAEIDAALARLTGAIAALAGITLPPDTSPEVLEHWDEIMTLRVIRPLMYFRRTEIRRNRGDHGRSG